MACQLPTECLSEILEYLEKDEPTLYSCLLVNRLWCKIAVRILWRYIWDFKSSYQQRSLKVSSSILSTLIACLPNESKELLHKYDIFISAPTLNPPLFNYAEFCKVFSINEITVMVHNVLGNELFIDSYSLVANEVIKMFTSQISSLKKFTYCYIRYYHLNISFSYVPGARDLSELSCSSNLPSSFFYQLSQICHNLQSISISFDIDVNVSNELKELISSQNNLKSLTLSSYDDGSWENIIPAITKHSQTITKLKLYSDNGNLPFLFVSLFTNLQEFIFSFYGRDFKDFEKLQYVNFPKLEILKIPYECPDFEHVVKFLENNGKNLKKFYAGDNDKVLSLSIADFCPNIISLFIIFSNDEIDILKTLFIRCQFLESITIWCGYYQLTVKEVLDTVVDYSPRNFHELKLYSDLKLEICPEELESYFIGWKNRIPKKLLSLTFIEITTNEEILKIIEKYENLGIIKFYTKEYKEDDNDEELDYYY